MIHQSLQLIEQNWTPENWEKGIKQAEEFLDGSSFIIEYISVCHESSLKKMVRFEPNAVALIAVRLGKTRLIDNILLGV
jgi:pantothenate synthetase